MADALDKLSNELVSLRMMLAVLIKRQPNSEVIIQRTEMQSINLERDFFEVSTSFDVLGEFVRLRVYRKEPESDG